MMGETTTREIEAEGPRWIGPGTRPAPRLPRWVWIAPIAGVGTALLHALVPYGLFEVFHALALLFGLGAGFVLGSWAERWLVWRIARWGGVARLALALFLPLGLLVGFVFVGILGEVALGDTASDGFFVMMLVPGGLWAAGRSLGSAVVEVVDVVVSAAVSTFRGRIVAAVSILVIVIGTSVAILLGLARQAASALVEHPETIKADLGGIDVSAKVREWVVAYPEAVTVLALGIAVLILLPALTRAMDRLAEAVMERIDPLFEAFEAIGEGDRRLRIEAGGSREFAKLAGSFNAMVEGLALSEQMERAFGSYVSPAVLDKIRAQHGDARLEPSEREATVFFCDIRNFTTLSEKLEPAAVMQLLNRYFARAVEVIDEHQGYLDKFIGDAVVVVFNGPIDQPDHLVRGLRCAAALVQAVAELNDEGAFEEVGGLSIGVGLATGPMVCGNLGAAGKLEYTVIGDTVNLASRLEGLTKRYRTPVLATGFDDPVFVDPVRVREIDRVVVKGKARAVRIYEVLDALGPELAERRQASLPAFEEGRRAYLAAAFDEARAAFERCDAEDAAVALHLERARQLEQDGLPEGWDGAHHFDLK